MTGTEKRNQKQIWIQSKNHEGKGHNLNRTVSETFTSSCRSTSVSGGKTCTCLNSNSTFKQKTLNIGLNPKKLNLMERVKKANTECKYTAAA